MSKQYKLCYVDDNILFFTDNFKGQNADDWNDRPYEHNAGRPYEWDDRLNEEENMKRGYGHIKLIAFDHYDGWNIRQPKDGHYNSPYSVEDINKGAVPWLYHEKAGTLFAGATMAKAKRWLKKAGVLWGELHE